MESIRVKAFTLAILVLIASGGCSNDGSDSTEEVIASYLQSAHHVSLPKEDRWWLVLTGSACSSCNDAVMEKATRLITERPDVIVVATGRLCRIFESRFPDLAKSRLLCDSGGRLERLDLSTKGVVLLHSANEQFVDHQEIREQDLVKIDRMIEP